MLRHFQSWCGASVFSSFGTMMCLNTKGVHHMNMESWCPSENSEHQNTLRGYGLFNARYFPNRQLFEEILVPLAKRSYKGTNVRSSKNSRFYCTVFHVN